DDRLINETSLKDTVNANQKWGPSNPFHHPQFIIVNLALGGQNGGDMEKAKLPAEYVIDYVRVYQRPQDKQFVAADRYVPPAEVVTNKVGIHHFSELPTAVNKKCGWEKGADSRCYAWKSGGRESVEMVFQKQGAFEGEVAHKFILRSGWSRWLLEMDPDYGAGVADLSEFKVLRFALKSQDAKDWESFRVIIESNNGKYFGTSMHSIGFKPDGKWHLCSIDLSEVKRSGVDLSKIKTLFAVAWEGGVSSGEYFMLDDLHLE
ncbi:MAG: hypothetical protein AAF483_06670, partial [Planctomycetota bacterium]